MSQVCTWVCGSMLLEAHVEHFPHCVSIHHGLGKLQLHHESLKATTEGRPPLQGLVQLAGTADA